MKSLQLECHRESSVLIISLHGRLDGNSSREFEKFVTEQLATESCAVILDAHHLTFLSSAGLRELMLLARRLGKEGRKASIVGTASLVREALEMTGIETLFHFSDDLDAARKAAQTERPKGPGFLESWFKRAS